MRQAQRSPPVRWRPLLALVAAVLTAHLCLLDGWATGPVVPLGQGGPGQARPVVQLLLPARPHPAAEGADAPRPEPFQVAAAALAAGPSRLSLSPPVRSTAAARRPDRPGPGPTAYGDLPQPQPQPQPQPAPAAAPGPADPATGLLAGPPDAAAAEDDAEPLAVADAPAPAGEPPPLYPAKLPPAATLRYALQYWGRSGQAVLHWRPAGATYALQLQGLPVALTEGQAPQPATGRSAPNRPLIEQSSQGQIDAHGLQPDRFTDRRRGRSQRAANFRHELGQIEFSGAGTAQPAWPGAQDRLSWWLQVPAILAAAATPPAEIRLFVVDARGRGELLRLAHLGTVTLPEVAGPAPLHHWRHEPSHSEGQRIELWLDPARSHWPAQLRLSSSRSAERFELRLLAITSPTP